MMEAKRTVQDACLKIWHPNQEITRKRMTGRPAFLGAVAGAVVAGCFVNSQYQTSDNGHNLPAQGVTKLAPAGTGN